MAIEFSLFYLACDIKEAILNKKALRTRDELFDLIVVVLIVNVLYKC